MDVANIKIGDGAHFRTVKMAADRPAHKGRVVAIAQTAKGAWVELEMADGKTLRTRASLVLTVTPQAS